jgi:hypothetical protein
VTPPRQPFLPYPRDLTGVFTPNIGGDVAPLRALTKTKRSPPRAEKLLTLIRLPEPEPSKSLSTRSDEFVFSEPLQLQHLASFSRQLDGDAIHLSAHPFRTLGMAV